MDHIGIDVHKRESQIYILAEGGEVIEQRIRTGLQGHGSGVLDRRGRSFLTRCSGRRRLPR